MSASSGEVARPTLRVRGLLGRTEPILIRRRAVADYREAFVGIDVAKLKNTIAIAETGREGEVRLFGEVDALATGMRRVVERIASRFGDVHFCYEAGPTGYGVYRLIRSLGHDCTVVAPSLIPRKPGDRVKTNRRDTVSLARLLRAGELTAVWVPDEGHEVMRDLVRARAAAVEALRGPPPTGERLHAQARPHLFPQEGKDDALSTLASGTAVRSSRASDRTPRNGHEAVRITRERVERLERTMEEFVSAWSLEPLVRALQTLRGINLIVAVTFATEVGDVSRCETSRQLMGYLGLVPGERWTGDGQAWRHH